MRRCGLVVAVEAHVIAIRRFAEDKDDPRQFAVVASDFNLRGVEIVVDLPILTNLIDGTRDKEAHAQY